MQNVSSRGKMIAYFITDQESPYFQSEQFSKVLIYLKDHPADVQMKQKNDRLSLVYPNVDGVEKAMKLISDLKA